jgi:membrane protein implicated in regulation of membrane protease activity
MIMSEGNIDKNLIILSLITWVAVAASVIAMVIYTGIPGVVFAFVVLVVAVGSWSKTVRDYNQKNKKQDDELTGEIKELIKEIQELKKSLEE